MIEYDPESWYYHYEPGMSLRTIIDRWGKQRPGKDKWGNPMPRQKMYDDDMPIMWSINELLPYREYIWSRSYARRSAEQWDELVEMMKHGWNKNNPLHFIIYKNGKAIVGEGNHRLAIASSLGANVVPVRFHFYSSDR